MKAATAIMASGARVDLRNPRLDLIHARDIAEQLSKLPMHGGATPGRFYSVAQHAVIVATELSREEGALGGFYGLLHHGEDLFGPTTAKFRAVFYAAFELDWPMPVPIGKALERVHARVHLSELQQLCAGRDAEIAQMQAAGVRPLSKPLRPLGWDSAMDGFIDMLRVLATAAAMPLSAMPAMGGLK